jgi:DNA-directed RNA polymerase specialized sigma24 family protein
MNHIAYQKIIDVARKQVAIKRDSNRDRSFYINSDQSHGLFEPKSHEPSPSQYAMAEEVRERLTHEAGLIESDSALIIRLKSQNYTNHEVAEATGMNLRKIQRLLKSLRDHFFPNT